MKKIITVNYTHARSIELRSKREISLTIVEGESSIEDLMLGEYVLIVNDRGIPHWVAQISRFVITSGDYPKTITASLGRIASLSEGWLEVSKIIRDKWLQHAKIELLDVEALFQVGNLLTSNVEKPFESLTAKDAATRLAWTYGVETSQVKISIEF
ncbi:hypothetical protein [Pseudomonas fluorescens]|uniref:Uncharacterized protein n=1 Tax=Pseudomonas fluorescens TaxID=294 RepID=A0A0F4V6L4_PSEFL|nr:hypothetical protein [Pseudomonas fluorescens]KJZ64404.1 hypothetical protein VD17_18230 [Pseudomonas fluorescens]